jgi:hypothetical protein
MNICKQVEDFIKEYGKEESRILKDGAFKFQMPNLGIITILIEHNHVKKVKLYDGSEHYWLNEKEEKPDTVK